MVCMDETGWDGEINWVTSSELRCWFRKLKSPN